jgi:hypothetical protein
MPAEVARCVVCQHPMTVIPGYRAHPGCDMTGTTELYCLGCGLGPAGCGCRTPRRWRPSAAALDATAARLADVLGGHVLPPPKARPPRGKCGGCGHAGHPKRCGAKAATRSVVMATRDGGTVRMCGWRGPCPCAWRACKCGAAVELAAELPAGAKALPGEGEVMIVSLERGSRDAPAGLLAVRKLADGFLACRTLPAGTEPGPGEWRATEHTNEACPLLATAEADPKWLSLRAA